MQTQQGDERPRSHAYAKLMAGCFFLLGAMNLLSRDWLGASLFLAGGVVVLKGREIDRWPKAARYLVVLAVGALAVAALVRIILKLRAGA
jgi:hypothetical protein